MRIYAFFTLILVFQKTFTFLCKYDKNNVKPFQATNIHRFTASFAQRGFL